MSEVKRYIAYQLYDAAKNLEPLPEGRKQVILATDYDAETARADRAEAGCAELSFALGVAYAAAKENGATLSEDCEQTICNALNNTMGQRFLELAQIVEGLPKYGPVKTYAGFTNNVKVYGLLLDDKEPTIEQYRELADALARLLAWRQGEK